MAIFYQLQREKSTSAEELVRALESSLSAQGLAITQSAISERKDAGHFYEVLGVITYGSLEYDIMFRDRNGKLTNAYNPDLVDLIKHAGVDGILKFTETGSDIARGVISLKAELSLKANADFLRKLAQGFKQSHPNMKRVNLAFLLDGVNNYEFEKV